MKREADIQRLLSLLR